MSRGKTQLCFQDTKIVSRASLGLDTKLAQVIKVGTAPKNNEFQNLRQTFAKANGQHEWAETGMGIVQDLGPVFEVGKICTADNQNEWDPNTGLYQ
jgi:hypothetical protein